MPVLRAVQLEEKGVSFFDGPEGATARPLEVYLIRIRFASFLSALLSSLSEMLVNVLCRFRQVQGPCGATCPDLECFLVALSDIDREGAEKRLQVDPSPLARTRLTASE